MALLPVNNVNAYIGTLPNPTVKASLTASDFTYLGYYDVKINGNDSPYGQGLTHRYVAGDLRFLHYSFVGGATGYVLDEFSIAGKAFGGQVTARTKRWTNIGYAMPNGQWYSLWWDEAQQRLWTTSAIDYTNTVVPTQIYTRTLNSDGTISNLHGPVSLQNITAKRVYGGAQDVPLWFQQQYGVGPYCVGWGGYTSLVDQGGAASMGPTLYTMPDPANFANGATVPTGQFKTLADYSGNHRGRRVTIPINYYDGGDPRQNPSTPPTVPPSAGAGWQSPGPDGLGYWVWGDTYWNTGCFIDLPTKAGYVAIGSFGAGKCYYATSTLHSDSKQYERHIFSPATLGAAAQGQILPYNVVPAMQEITLPGLPGADTGNTPVLDVAGATFDKTTNTHYLIGMGVNTFWARLYAFHVN